MSHRDYMIDAINDRDDIVNAVSPIEKVCHIEEHRVEKTTTFGILTDLSMWGYNTSGLDAVVTQTMEDIVTREVFVCTKNCKQLVFSQATSSFGSERFLRSILGDDAYAMPKAYIMRISTQDTTTTGELCKPDYDKFYNSYDLTSVCENEIRNDTHYEYYYVNEQGVRTLLDDLHNINENINGVVRRTLGLD